MTTLPELLERIDKMGGFLTEDELTKLVELDRLRICLCRFSGGRLLTAAQDVNHFLGIIEESGKDYLRDVSLPASDPVFSGDYTTRTTPEPPGHPVAGWRAEPRDLPGNGQSEEPYRGGPESADYGGAFDGFNLTSDADPGL